MKTRKVKHSRFFILSDRYTSSFSSDLDPIPTKESFKTLYTEQKVIFKYNQMALIAFIWFYFFSVLLDMHLILIFFWEVLNYLLWRCLFTSLTTTRHPLADEVHPLIHLGQGSFFPLLLLRGIWCHPQREWTLTSQKWLPSQVSDIDLGSWHRDVNN